MGSIDSINRFKRPSSRRGVRAGKSAKRNKEAKHFIPFGLVNARSLSKQSNLISHFILNHDLDLLAVIETWLTASNSPSRTR